MKKRLLYMEDLYSYYSSHQRASHFNYEESGRPIVVQVKGNLSFDADDNTEGLCKVHLQACHTGKNRNGSNISDEVMIQALPSFSNRPILGYIHEVDGQPEFYAHNLHTETNSEGEEEIVYDEAPVGVIPESCDARLAYDYEKKKRYVEVDGFIFEEYSKAADILKREEQCKVSVELSIRDLTYNAREKELSINDFYFSGVTILGKDDDGNVIEEGMSGSNVTLADFRKSQFSRNLLCEMDEKLDQLLHCFNIDDNEGKEETNVGDENEVIETLEEETVEETVVEPTPEAPEEDVEASPEAEGEDETQEAEESSESEATVEDTVFTKTFELSNEDVRVGLYRLLAANEEEDNEWYMIVATYTNRFVYQGLFGGAYYGQNYSVNGDEVSFEGERYSLYPEFLTADEKTELEKMRAEYSELKTFKQSVEEKELHEEREKVLADARYDSIRKSEPFKKLVSEMDNYSVDELKKEAKVIFADCVADIGTFANTAKTLKVNVRQNETEREQPYGGLFDFQPSSEKE